MVNQDKAYLLAQLKRFEKQLEAGYTGSRTPEKVRECIALINSRLDALKPAKKGKAKK